MKKQIQKKSINWSKAIWLEISRTGTRMQGLLSSCSIFFNNLNHITSGLYGTGEEFSKPCRTQNPFSYTLKIAFPCLRDCSRAILDQAVSMTTFLG